MPIDREAMYRSQGLEYQQPPLSTTLKATPDYSPDEHAQDLELGGKLGLPADVIKENRDKAQVDAQFADVPESKIRKDTPALASMLEGNPDFAIISKDDISSLYDAARTAAAIKERTTPGYFSNAGRRSLERMGDLAGWLVQGAESAGEFIGEGAHTMMMDNEERAAFAKQKAERVPSTEQSTQTKIAEALRSVDYGSVDNTDWDEGKQLIAQGNYAAGVAKLASGGFFSALTSTPDMAMIMLNLPSYLLARQEELSYERAQNQGRAEPNEEDRVIGGASTMAVALLERFGIQRMFKAVKSTDGFWKSLSKGATAEGATEFPQEIVEYLGTNLGTVQGATFLEALERGFQGLVGGVTFGGAVTGGGKAAQMSFDYGAQRARDKAKALAEETLQKADEAGEFEKGIRDLGQKVQGTKTFGRNREFLGQLITESAGNQELYLDRQGFEETLSMMDPDMAERLVNKLGLRKELEVNNGANTDLSIPIGKIVNAVDDPMFDGILQDLKSDPFGLTPRKAQEAKDAMSDPDKLEQMAEELMAKEAPDSKRTMEAEDVRLSVENQLLETGFSSEDAAAQAEMHRHMAVLLSEWTGRSVKDAYGELRVRRQVGEQVVTAPVDPITAAATNAANPQQDRRQGTAQVEADQRQGDRRVDQELRAKVAAMSPEEQFQAIYTNELTGLPNRRAFEELAEGYPLMASIDIDTLGVTNDTLGQNAGDELLRIAGQALEDALPGQIFHMSGDEFYAVGSTQEELDVAMAEARAALRDAYVASEKGELRGLNFSYGIAEEKAAADSAMKQNKKDREATGDRVPKTEMPKGLSLNKTLGQSATLRAGKENIKDYGLDPSQRNLNRDVAIALMLRQVSMYGHIKKGDHSLEAKRNIAKWIAAEVRFEMQHPENSGLGWYGPKWHAAIDAMGQAYPELLEDQDARNMFTLIMAFTSDGARIKANFDAARRVYEGYRVSLAAGNPHLEMIPGIGGERAASYAKNINILNQLMQEYGTGKELHEFLMQEKTVKELRDAFRHDPKFSVAYEGKVTQPLAVGYLGPKLGAFYANLMGSHGYLTMDRWWSRTFNRYRGELLMEPTEDGIIRVRQLMIDAGIPADLLTNEDGSPDRDAVIVATAPYERSYAAKGHKDGSDLEVAANTVHKAAFAMLRDTPDNASDRTFMLESTKLAQKNLKRSGIDMSLADIQAVLWYYEKRLYGELGARDSADISYLEAAKEVLGQDLQDSGVNIEVAPSLKRNRELAEGYDELTPQAKAQITHEVAEAVVRDAAAQMGLPEVEIQYTNGGYLGQVNPSLTLTLPGPVPTDVAARFKEYLKLRDLGTVLGEIFSQDAIVVYDEGLTEPRGRGRKRAFPTNHVRIKVDGPELTRDEQEALFQHISSKIDKADGYAMHEGAMVFGDFNNIGPTFEAQIFEALKDAPIDRRVSVLEKSFLSSYVEIADGKTIQAQKSEGSKLLGGRKGGGRTIREYQEQAQGIIRNHLETTYGQPVRTGPVVPESLKPGGLKTNANGMVPLTHWSNTDELTTLDPALAGTGVDNLRRRSNPDAPRFVYFGAPGYRAESTVVSLSKSRYYAEIDPATLYDVQADPMGFYDAAKEANPDGYPYQWDAAYQQAIIDAGYAGHHFEQGNNGTVVAVYNPIKVKKARTIKTKHKDRHAHIAGFDAAGNAYEEVTREQKRRGEITLGRSMSTITLLPGADKSTFLHESAHHFLHRLELFAADSPMVAEQLQVVLDWMGVEHVSEIGEKEHEQFADGFEVFLHEGRAPTPALRGVFARFRQFIMSAYKTVEEFAARLGYIKLNDEMRDFYGRLVASDTSLAQAEKQLHTDPVMTENVVGGMTAAEFREYQSKVKDARDISQSKVDKVVLEDLTREKNSEFKARFNTLKAQFMETLGLSRAYVARGFLQTGKGIEGLKPFKLNREQLEAMLDEETYAKLPTGRYGVSKNGGMDLEAAAELLKYESVDEMVRDLTSLGELNEEASKMARTQAKHELGYDPKDQASIDDAARQALLSKARADVLHMELSALDRLSGGRGTPRGVIKKAAARQVEALKLVDLKPGTFLSATITAAQESARHFQAKRYEKAAQAKREQLFNHYMYMMVRDARSNSESGRRYFKKFYKKTIGKRVDGAYLTRIHAILAPFSFKQTTQKERDAAAELRKWVQDKMDAGQDVMISPRVIAMASKQSYKDMTVAEMRELQDAVKNLEHLGVMTNKFKDMDWKEAKREMIDHLVTAGPIKPIARDEKTDFKNRNRRDLQAWVSKMNANLKMIEFIAIELDGGKRGRFWEQIWLPISEAQDKLAIEKERVAREIANLYVDNKVDGKSLHEGIYIEEINETLNREEILAIALNMGNEGNKERLLNANHSTNPNRSTPWSPEELSAILGHLKKNEWQLVQDIWDKIDEFWPDIAALQTKVTGLPPVKVEATPVFTKYGKFRGGYYPIMYNTDMSEMAYRFQEDATVRQMQGGNATRASTRQGHNEARLESTERTLTLKLNVIDRHISDVLLDLTHREPIADAVRMIRDTEVENAIKSRVGVDKYRELNRWLAWTSGSYSAMPNKTGYDQLFRRVRVGASHVGIGLRLTTALLNFTGLSVSMTEVGPVKLFKNFMLMSNPATHGEQWAKIKKLSPFMATRSRIFERELSEQYINPAKPELLNTSYILIAGVDHLVASGTWLGAFEEELERNGQDEKAAAAFADSVVRTTQGSARAADMANMLRSDNEFKKLITIFYSYFNMILNRTGVAWNRLKADRNPILFLKDMVLIWWLPALLADLFANRGPDDEDKEEGLLGWGAWGFNSIANYGFGMFPMGSAVYQYATRQYGFEMTPAAQGIESAVDLGKLGYKLFDEDAEIKVTEVTKPIAEVFGYWLHVPGMGQLNKTIDYVVNKAENHDVSLPGHAWYAIYGEPK